MLLLDGYFAIRHVPNIRVVAHILRGAAREAKFANNSENKALA